MLGRAVTTCQGMPVLLPRAEGEWYGMWEDTGGYTGKEEHVIVVNREELYPAPRRWEIVSW